MNSYNNKNHNNNINNNYNKSASTWSGFDLIVISLVSYSLLTSILIGTSWLGNFDKWEDNRFQNPIQPKSLRNVAGQVIHVFI